MSVASESPLIFNWGPPRPRARALVIFIIASLLFHLFCFYLFQIVYPPTSVALPPPARVSFIAGNTEEGRALLRWIESEDPALTSATQRPPESRIRVTPKLEQVPSYLNRQPSLKDLPPQVVDLRGPSAFAPGPAPLRSKPSELPSHAAKTTVLFSEELAGLGAATFPETEFKAATAEPPESIRFRVAIGPRGEVRYLFRLNSSGDAALDEQARRHIVLARFPQIKTANDESLVWGVATLNWGNDIARPASNVANEP